ncbi:MAG: accessory gene regulator B family protein [Lachnospiraceae bacterium]|nr:accessory gene regulator B family protein [Lachnospiraceae bacterium]
MFDRVAEQIAGRIFAGNDFDDEKKEVVIYGLSQLLTGIFNLITILVIGIAYGMPIQAVIFTITYILLRIYAGGYHADTPVRCYVFSVVMIMLVLSGIKWLKLSKQLYLMSSVVCGLFVFFLSPVDNVNKRLDDKEYMIYGRMARVIVTLELILILVFYQLNARDICIAIEYAIITMCMMLVLGKVKNREEHEKV